MGWHFNEVLIQFQPSLCHNVFDVAYQRTKCLVEANAYMYVYRSMSIDGEYMQQVHFIIF